MKRFFSVLLFLLLAITMFWSILEYAKEQEQAAAEPMVATEETLKVYTDLPMDALSDVGRIFYEETGIQVDIVFVNKSQLLAIKEGESPDLYLTAQENLDRLKAQNKLTAYVSPQTDVTLELFKDNESYWHGLWMDPFVFVANKDFSGKYPLFNYNWTDILILHTLRISFTDFLTNDTAADFLFGLIEHFGQKEAFFLLSVAQSHIIQYGKYLSTPSRLAGMGKCDIGVSTYNEAVKTQKEKLPISIFYPTDGTGWYLYGVALSSQSPHLKNAKKMIDWLSEPKRYKEIIEKRGSHYIYINDADKVLDANGTELTYWPLQKNYSDKGRKEILNYWMENIRFGRNQ